MIDFILKSTISLGILFLLYRIFLKDLKTFHFNRYFLIGSLLFSLVVPIISIPIDIEATTFSGSSELVNRISLSIVQMDENNYLPRTTSTISFSIIPYLYGLVSLILLGRFSINLSNIIETIRGSHRIRKSNHCLVLDKNCSLPYTFFNHIIVPQADYEKRIIDQRIMQHEMTHAKQLHSVDIVIVEILRILIWINPFVWLMKKPMQLNHEYLADSSVLTKNTISKYQYILLNVVLSKSSGLLTSNFNFSLTKQRLEMMTKRFSMKQAIINILASCILVLLLGSVLAFNLKKDFEYKLDVNGVVDNYAKKKLKHSDFAMLKITTNNKKIKVKEFDITLARGKRAVHNNAKIQGNQFDLKYYSDSAKKGDRIVIEIKKLSDKTIELTQYNSIITIPIDFDK